MPEDNTSVNPIPPLPDPSSSGVSSDPPSFIPPLPTVPDSTQPTDGVDSSTTTSPSTSLTSDSPMPEPTAQSSTPDQSMPIPATQEEEQIPAGPDDDIRAEVVSKMGAAKNVLIALSSDPTVDEMATAIGLSLYLDRLGKRATAIYSGTTPNALEFLKPEDTFESTADTLQDFVIALNKDKADHLRYKLDGDFVKIYITPYRARISENDLDYSYGDYNVDLVLALDVANGIDLDSALREHGRIMHDAVIVNITTGNPGKFGEIEWSDKAASSVAEMISRLLYDYGGDNKPSKDEATAFLTGIVAATNRFSNAKTTPVTMKISSRLMESGANQQLVSKNITPDVDNELFNLSGKSKSKSKSKSDSKTDSEAKPEPEPESESSDQDPTSLNIEHAHEPIQEESKDDNPSDSDDDLSSSTESNPSDESSAQSETSSSSDSEPLAPSESSSTPEPATSSDDEDNSLLDELKTAEQSLTDASAETIPPVEQKPIDINNMSVPEPIPLEPTLPEPIASEPNVGASSSTQSNYPEEPIIAYPSPTNPGQDNLTPTAPITSSGQVGSTSAPATEFTLPNPTPGIINEPEKIVTPNEGFDATPTNESTNRYGKMLQDALDGLETTTGANSAISSSPDDMFNPAAASAPSAPSTPEINGVPEMNYAPMPGEDILPPPPAPPIDVNQSAEPMPLPQTSFNAVNQPQPMASPTPTQPDDPSAFKIPGM